MTDNVQENIEKDIVEDEGKEKLVPVSESIRYRKRAQAAENKLTEIEGQYNETVSQKESLSQKLNELKLQNSMIMELSDAGIRDMEAGLVLVKSRMQNESEIDVHDIVSGLQKEKQYLFKNNRKHSAGKTAGVKSIAPETEKILAQAAKRAAASGSRRDIQEYLKLRRNFL